MTHNTYDMPFEIKSVSDDGTIEGYGSSFDKDPDSYGDVIEYGAYSDTIKNGGRNRNGILMLWNHNPSEPIGKWDYLEEDQKGLYVKGTFDLNVARAREIHSLSKKKIIQGLSIGFDIQEKEFDSEKKIRILKKLELWEISPVTFPAKINANIIDVKSFEDCRSIRELEGLLRESGLSKQQALYISKMCKDSFNDLRESESGIDELSQILESLKNFNGGN